MIFVASDGVRIHCQSRVRPDARADVLVLHGLGEHSGRYAEFAERLGRGGYNVHLLDWRGHGCSEGLTGHVAEFAQFHRDIASWVVYLVEHELLRKDRPVFLFGHSMGGLIALDFLLNFRDAPVQKFAGLALSSPAVGVLNPAAMLKPALDFRLPALLEQLHFPNGIAVDDLMHDKKKRAEFLADPLVHRKITISLFREMLGAIERVRDPKTALPLPVLLLYAGDDRIVDPEAEQKFAKNLKAKDKEVHGFRGFYHEIFNETKREEAYARFLDWLKKWTTPAKIKVRSSAKSSASKATAKGILRSRPARKATSTSISRKQR